MKAPWRPAVVAVALAAAAIAAGCGSDDDSSTSTSSAGASTGTETTSSGGEAASLQAEIEELMVRPTKIGITEPIEEPLPEGGTIDYMQCGVPDCADLAQPLKDAAAAAGWEVKVIDIGLTPEEVKAGWQQAVRDNPDAIVTTGGFPAEFFEEELDQIAAKDIPVVTYGDAAVEPPHGMTAVVNGGVRFELIGELWAKLIAAQSGGDGNILYVHTSTFPVTGVSLRTFKETLSEVCPDCKVEEFDAPATSIGKDLAQKIASRVQANPETDYIIGAFADMTTGVPDALAAVGRTAGTGDDDVKIVTQDQGPQLVEAIKDGQVLTTFSLPGGETQWQSMDIILRSKLGLPIEGSTDIESYTKWFVTQDNMPSDLSSGEIENVADYQEQFKKLWGIG